MSGFSYMLTSTSSSKGIARVCISNISARPSLSGTRNSISLSKRPGLRKAGSRASGRFVAPITITLPLSFSPSISASICATTRRSTSPVASSLLGAMASISSMNITVGALAAASSKISLISFSLSPQIYS